MRTEQDLRRVLAQRDELVPDADAVMTGVRRVAARRRRRRAAGAIIGAASAVVLVATLGGTLSALRSSPRLVQASPSVTTPAAVPSSPNDVPSAPRPPFAFTVAAGTAAGFEFVPQSVSADQQGVLIFTAGDDVPVATLFVYPPGTDRTEVWDGGSEPPTRSTPVTVNGAPGFYSANADVSGLSWQYARDSWAFIGGDPSHGPMAQERMVNLAEAVRFVAPYQARVPYRLTYLPTDLVPFNVVQEIRGPGARRSVVQLESRDQNHQRIVDITIDDRFSPFDTPVTHTTIGGYPAVCTQLVDGRRCAVHIKGLVVDLGGGFTPTERERLVAGMRFAVWTDARTWAEVSAVFPGTS
jgi:hypothetical protein